MRVSATEIATGSGAHHGLEQLAYELGKVVAQKADQYGDSIRTSEAMMQALYPDGVKPHQYRDALIVVRMLDKLCRIANREQGGKDKGGESPWFDICGYALRALEREGDAS